uniref:Uncharacterized protein n=1 Tax=Ditylenchus dipsaci TaxID=166011 RepID=A0A915DZR3_9BILA
MEEDMKSIQRDPIDQQQSSTIFEDMHVFNCFLNQMNLWKWIRQFWKLRKAKTTHCKPTTSLLSSADGVFGSQHASSNSANDLFSPSTVSLGDRSVSLQPDNSYELKTPPLLTQGSHACDQGSVQFGGAGFRLCLRKILVLLLSTEWKATALSADGVRISVFVDLEVLLSCKNTLKRTLRCQISNA